MNYWIVIHRFSNYIAHKDLIGLPVKKDRETGELLRTPEGNLIPKNSTIEQVQVGDHLAYYCPAPKQVVIGLFKIVDGPKNPGYFTSDWEENLHFRIEPLYPVEEENSIPFYDLGENLNYFKSSEGEPLGSKAKASKLKGTLKKIEKEDFDKIVSLYTKTEPGVTPPEDSLHLRMIKTTHIQATGCQCHSFIGSQERNRVNKLISDEEEEQISSQEDLPSWMSEIGTHIKTYKRLLYIDNLWFFEESPGFYIPFAAFEHEKDGNLKTAFDHFAALKKTLKSSSHFKDIKPLYFLIAKDSHQANSYRNRISEHGDWRDFEMEHEFYIFSIDDIDLRNLDYLTILTNHLRSISKSS